MPKKCIILILVSTIFLFGCGKKQESGEITVYQQQMSDFQDALSDMNDKINSIDPESENAVSELLSYYDELNQIFLTMNEYEIPEEYSSVQILSDRAYKYMNQAVLYYHTAFESSPLDQNALETANSYYETAITYVNYIGQVFMGATVTIE